MTEATGTGRFTLICDVVGSQVEFIAVAGEVVGVERWTDTDVWSYGGSVHVHGNQVSVVRPKIWTTATARKAVWIKTERDEVRVPVPEGLQVRQGHRVHAVIATGVDRGTSQWAAIVNHDTNRWTQVDPFPPCRCYDPWTSFLVALGRGKPDPTKEFLGLYGLGLVALLFLLGGTGGSILTGLVVGLGIGTVHRFIAGAQSRSAKRQYGRAVKQACDGIFEATG